MKIFASGLEMANSLFWFRGDLRLDDNPALCKAAKHGKVLAIYILDDVNSGSCKPGAASRWWLHKSLISLDRSLQGRLTVLQGNALEIIPELVRQHDITQVFWNRCYEPWQIARDKTLKQQLQDQGIRVTTENASLLWEPWKVSKQDGTPYRVFTPFYQRGCLQQADPPQAITSPANLQLVDTRQAKDKIQALALLPDIDWYRSFEKQWQPGEPGARLMLETFLDQGISHYKTGRDFPALKAVSRLSPYLHSGEISPQQVLQQVKQHARHNKLESQGEHFLRELAWREFSYYLMFHFPHLHHSNLRTRFDNFPWRNDEAAFRRWCEGRTGFPLVDAGMRELWQTGYMHNRVRMIVASFLVKNLMIHWRRGAAWFWDCLVDADLANNSASWQWVAGSGADAAPYFRIFNPVTQSLRFDPKGEYIRQYVPEIAALADRYIHDPSSAPETVLQQAGLKLGKDYPTAMVDLKSSRERALAAYRELP